MTTYYVDFTGGLDGNSGTSELAPWKTLDKADDGPYNAGDSILLKRGEEWREAYLVPSNGSSGSPITLGVYGSGADPIINGADLITGWSDASPPANSWSAACTTEPGQVFFDGVKGTKEAAEANLNAPNEWFWEANVLYVYSTGDPDDDYTSPGIEAEAQSNCIWCSKDYITVSGLDIKYGENGIKFSSASHPTVDNCTVHDTDESGIVFFNISDNITVTSCTVYSCGSAVAHSGIYIDDTTIGTISDCTIYDIYTGGDGRGISLIDSSAITIEECTIYDNGDTASDGVAIEFYNADSCIIRYNECYGSYNIIEIQTGSDDNQFCYNIFRDDTGNALIEFGVGQTGNEFYNNVLAAPNEDNMTCYSGVGNTIKNNIFHGVTGTKHCIYYDCATYATLDYNCYDPNANGDIINDVQGSGGRTLAEWQADSSQDANSMTSDPLFADAANDNFRLQPISPCINAGVDVGLNRDFVGVFVPQGPAPDIGAYEFLGTIRGMRRKETIGLSQRVDLRGFPWGLN